MRFQKAHRFTQLVVTTELDPKGWANITFEWMTTPGKNEGAEDELQYPRLHAFSLAPSIDLKVQSIGKDTDDWALAFYVGAGAGFTRFSGDDLEAFWRFSLEPRGSIMLIVPDNRLHIEYVDFRYTLKYFYQGFKAEDFGDMNSSFSTDGDTVQTLSVLFGINW